MDTKHNDKPTEAITSPNATYRASENVPSVRTLLPPPKFPKLDSPPESAQAPAGITFDRSGLTPSTDGAAVGTITKPQENGGFLTRPHRFDPKTGKMLPVADEPGPSTRPTVARPIHDVSRSKPSN